MRKVSGHFVGWSNFETISKLTFRGNHHITPYSHSSFQEFKGIFTHKAFQSHKYLTDRTAGVILIILLKQAERT